jgi:hypothetical protein
VAVSGRTTITTSRVQHFKYTKRHLAANQMPIPQSARAQLFQNHPIREGWETTIMLWYVSSLGLLVAILGYTPNTNIEDWAREEAMLRLDGRKPVKFGKQLMPSGPVGNFEETAVSIDDDKVTHWDKFAHRAVQWTKDDDDDEEEEEAKDDTQFENHDNVAERVEQVFIVQTTASIPNIWRRISNVFSAWPEVQEEPKSDNDDDEEW